MKRFAVIPFLAVCLLASSVVGQEAKKNELKYEVDDLTGRPHRIPGIGLNLKAVKVDESAGKGELAITFIFECKRDSVSGDTLRTIFAGKPYPPKGILKLVFFDKDNVLLTKQALSGKTEGEITGKAGDAFRYIQSVPNTIMTKAKKVALRFEKQ